MAKSERSYQSNQTKWWKCKYYFKKFITFLFSHIGLTGSVVGYIILGAIVFRELEIGYERQIKGKVLQNRAKFADMIYLHCRSFSQAQMFAHAMTPCPTMPTTPSSFFNNDFIASSTTTLSPYFDEYGLGGSTQTPYNNSGIVVTDMRNSNNYGDGDDRLGTLNGALNATTTVRTTTSTTTTTTTTSTTTFRPTTTTAAQSTSSSRPLFFYTSQSPTTPTVSIDRRELQSRVGDAIVDLWQSAEMRQLENVVADNTWEINERFNVLYKRNWTREARRELRQLERRLLQRVYTQIMMSIFGAGDLRANELSLDLDDSMVTEAPPETPLSGSLMDEVRRRPTTTTPSGRRREQRPRRPTRSVELSSKEIHVDDENSETTRLVLLMTEKPRLAQHAGNVNFDQHLPELAPDETSVDDSKTMMMMLPSLKRFKRQTRRLPQSSIAISGSPTVGPPDSAGRRRLSPLLASITTTSTAKPFLSINATANNNSNRNVFNSSSLNSAATADDENDAIVSVDADDDDDVLLFGEEKLDAKDEETDNEDDSSPPARQPPDYSLNNTGEDYFSHRRRIGLKATDSDDEFAVTPTARNETVERLLEILHNQDWLLSDQQEHYFNRSVFDLVIFFEQNVSAFILKEGYDGSMDRELWSFSGGLLFSLTVITTIGYGHIAPKTVYGRCACVVYSLFGIPLMLLCLANIGDAMAIAFKFIYWKICCLYCHYKKRQRRLKRARSVRSLRKSPLPSALRKQSGKSQDTSGSGSMGRGGGPGGETSSRSGVGGESNPVVAITGPSSSPNLESYMNFPNKPSIGSGIVTGDRLLAGPQFPCNVTTTTTSTSSSSAPRSSSPSSSIMKEIIVTTTELPAPNKTPAAPAAARKASLIDDASSNTGAKMPFRMPPGIRSAAALLATTPELQSTTAAKQRDIEEGLAEESEMNLLSAPQQHGGGSSGGAASGESETEFSTAIIAVTSDEHSDTSKQPRTASFVVPTSTSDEWASGAASAAEQDPSSPDLLPEERRRLLTTKQTTGPLGERRISTTLSAPLHMRNTEKPAGGIKKAKKVITIDRAVSEPGELAIGSSTPTSAHHEHHHQMGGDANASPAVTTSQANFESWGSLEGDNFTERYKRVNVPVWACLLVVVLYLFGGGVMFSQWEGWNVFEGAYFCFISLTTIGFGDIVPGFSAVETDRDAQIKMALCALYLLFGMALLAMSFNLVQENVIETCKNLARRIGILVEEEDENI